MLKAVSSILVVRTLASIRLVIVLIAAYFALTYQPIPWPVAPSETTRTR